MPEQTKATPLGEFMKRKVGPFPMGVWLAAAIVAIWYYRKKQADAAAAANPAAEQSQTGYGTDPAGNVGYIDPQTGYVYGSAEDIAALQNQGLVGANQYATGGGTGDTSGVGATADTTGATSVTPSGTSTATPGFPSGGTTTPGGAAPAPRNWHYPAPSGLAADAVSDRGYRLHWNAVQGPAGQHPSSYTVATYQMNGKKVDQFTAHSTSTAEYGAGGKGLHPGWQYRTNVWANGGPTAPPHASIVVTIKPKGTK